MEGDCLHLTVGNPAPPPAEGTDRNGAGHAQRSIGLRLAHAFGGRARMAAGWNAGYYRCELQVPVASARTGQ
jgi:two-component system sensor histidine kinase AlgZ